MHASGGRFFRCIKKDPLLLRVFCFMLPFFRDQFQSYFVMAFLIAWKVSSLM